MFIDIFDQFYISFAAVSSTIGVASNIFLLYLVFFKSPPFLTPYTVFLANTSISQLAYSICFILTIPRVISINFRIVNIYLGVSQFFGHWWSYMIFVTMLHCAVNSFISIMLSMVFRCISLKTLRFPTSAALLMCLIAYIIPLSMIVSIRNIDYTSNFTINNEYTHWKVDNLEKYQTVVGTDLDQKSTIWIMICVSLLCIPIYSVMYYCRKRILLMLEKPSYVFNTSTTIQIRKLVKALTVQASIPAISLFPASLIFLSNHFYVLETECFGYIIISFLSLSPMIDPFVTIYYVQPYRKFVTDLLWIDEHPSSSSPANDRSYRSRSNSIYMMRNAAFV
ncbi:unnamed protein product [Caenorhabditis bovis]|uniref:G-protein coupled receptors family 1 profile domain-containing protein n=1 Tax=Caenorhabditis bovis TaxID=2654633 RepID=A0A8S1E622_9PELO|nr:unnamed protein product [Caenorhabditis bovis]